MFSRSRSRVSGDLLFPKYTYNSMFLKNLSTKNDLLTDAAIVSKKSIFRNSNSY